MNIRRVLKHYLQESRLNHLAPFNTCCTSRRPILKSHAAHGPIRSTPRCMRSNLWSIREKTSAIAWGQMAKHLQGKHTHPSKFSSHHPNSAAKVGKLKSKWLWNSKSCSRRAWPWPDRLPVPPRSWHFPTRSLDFHGEKRHDSSMSVGKKWRWTEENVGFSRKKSAWT